jgi:adenylate dimethylallyltransferase
MTHIHLIFGPTTCGKTDRSIELAARRGAPVIVLDRIQCHPEVAVGSGRPSQAELRGTLRHYLLERPLADTVATDEAHDALVRLVESHARRERLLILEGGSVSLLTTMVADPYWKRYAWSWERLSLPSTPDFPSRLDRRMRAMLRPPDGSPGMLHELAAVWPDPRSRAAVLALFTYELAARAAARAGLPVERAPELSEEAMPELTRAVGAAVWRHARWQDDALPSPPWVR